MEVQVRVLFAKPTEDDWREMRSLANGLWSDPDSVRVLGDEKPEWLVAEFSMPTEEQGKAVEKSTECFGTRSRIGRIRRLPFTVVRPQRFNARLNGGRRVGREDDVDREERSRDRHAPLTEGDLRPIAGEVSWERQRKAWRGKWDLPAVASRDS